VEFDALEQSWAGPVEVGLRSRHHSLDMSVHPPARALDETWHLRLYRMSNSSPYTLFDLDLEHQCATDDPLILPEYHYGGLGFRGHSNWNGAEKCFFLTSNGETNRVRGHATRANWCWMGGFVDNKLTGIAILCHPDNIRAPQAMRLHPTEPFFCFAPQLLGDMAIEPGQPLVSQYRFVVLDGYPRADFLDQLWLEYALAPQVEYQANSIDPIPPVAPAASESVESASAHSKTVHRPNVLFLFADDQTYETIRAGGHTDIDTPNLDRLTARGTTFSHVYNMGSFSPAVCVASRTMLVTGRTLWQARQLHNPEAIRKEADAGRLWPLQMREVGYQTFFTGKWHVPIDPAHVFDTVRHVRPGMPKDTAEGYSRPSPGIPDPWDPSDPKFGGFWEGGQHWSEVTADDAIDFLQIARDDPRPFFLYTAFNAPHDPRQSPAERLDTYPLERMKVPPSFLPEYPEKDLIGCPPSLRDEKLGPFPRTEHAVKVHRREYYALITHMDAQIGRILDALESSGQAANTYIFFTADHGLAVGHHGLFGKQNMYDHSLRVPFIVVGPDVPHGLTIATPALVQDVAPTVMELAGVQKPDWMAFRSLLPQILNPTVPTTAQPVYAAYLDLQRAVIADDYKLIHYPKADVTKLFHLPSDPLELRDLAQHPAYAGVQLALKSRLAQLKEVYHDPY
jgi:choline-sulfatase